MLRVKPLVKHTITSTHPAWQIFLAPYSTFAVKLTEIEPDKDIAALSPNALPFHAAMSNEELVDILDVTSAESNVNIDSRLAAVLEEMENAKRLTSLTQVAKKHNLSASRLRVIAHEQIGVPLSMLIVFRKSVKAVKALSSGATLSEAAHAGGFCDQAHFTRTVRQLYGTTPSTTVDAFAYEKE